MAKTTQYAAFLRGIGPGNPNMTNDKLRGVFESLGFSDVRSVISSGNILFASIEADTQKLENDIEAALQTQLGIGGKTIVRSKAQLHNFVTPAPFGDYEHSKETYLTVTFLKTPQAEIPFDLPYENESKSFKILSFDQEIQAICGITNTATIKTPDFMAWLEKNFSKDITTRTWKTILRIADKF